MNPILEVLRDELERALGGLDEHQTRLRPAGIRERWSIQQIVGHLALTYNSTAEVMDARLAKGAGTRAKPSAFQRAGQFAIIRMGYFPHGRIAPDRVVPAIGETAMPSGLLIARLTDSLLALDRKTTAAESLFGSRPRVATHIVLGPLSISQWRKFHLVHGRHHIMQIQAIRRDHRV